MPKCDAASISFFFNEIPSPSCNPPAPSSTADACAIGGPRPGEQPTCNAPSMAQVVVDKARRKIRAVRVENGNLSRFLPISVNEDETCLIDVKVCVMMLTDGREEVLTV